MWENHPAIDVLAKERVIVPQERLNPKGLDSSNYTSSFSFRFLGCLALFLFLLHICPSASSNLEVFLFCKYEANEAVYTSKAAEAATQSRPLPPPTGQPEIPPSRLEVHATELEDGGGETNGALRHRKKMSRRLSTEVDPTTFQPKICSRSYC